MNPLASASEAIIMMLSGFPRPEAEIMSDSLRAAREMGAWSAYKQFKAKNLALPEHLAALAEYEKLASDPTAFGFDFDITPKAALRYLEGKTPMDWKKVPGLQDGYLRADAFWITGVE